MYGWQVDVPRDVQSKKGHWTSSVNGHVPPNAVRGGHDHSGDIFVGRADHNGEVIPGKVVPTLGKCYIPYGGDEHEKHHYEVLTHPERYEWVQCHGSHFPHDAVPGGHTRDGEALYIARAHHDGTLAVGKVHPSHHCCYISYGGKEWRYENYEVLVFRD